MTDQVMHYFDRACRRKGNQPALIGADGEVWSFLELEARVDWMAAGLRKEGIGAGDRVIVMIPMSLELYQVLLALLKIGAVAVFVDPWVGLRQIAAFAAYGEPKGFIGVPKSHLIRLFDRRLRQLPVTLSTGRVVLGFPARQSLKKVERYFEAVPIHDAGPEETALITFTSGSSGIPKGADRTHRFLAAQHEALKRTFPYEEDDVDMPMFPVFSLNNLATGITTVIPDMNFREVAAVDGARILEQITTHSVTTLTGSPPFFDALVEAIAASGAEKKRPPIRRILTGGAPVKDGQLRRWKEVLGDLEILVVYGSTEAEPVAHLSAQERLRLAEEKKSAGWKQVGFCVGRPVSVIETKRIRIQKGPVSLGARGWEPLLARPEEPGELVVAGDHVCARYYRNEEATKENKIIDADGRVWHRMGDTGLFDDQGRFWLTGRVYSTIRRGSESFQAQVVEEVARGERENLQVAALEMGSPGAEQLWIVLYTSEPREERTAEVEADLLAAGIRPDRIFWAKTSLPVDPRHNSKIDYRRLREELETTRRDQ